MHKKKQIMSFTASQKSLGNVSWPSRILTHSRSILTDWSSSADTDSIYFKLTSLSASICYGFMQFCEIVKITESDFFCRIREVPWNLVESSSTYLPRWLRWLRHSAHWPGRSIGGAVVQFPGWPVGGMHHCRMQIVNHEWTLFYIFQL